MNKEKSKFIFNETMNIFDILIELWNNKIFILKVLIIFFLIGIFYSLSLKNIYRASTIFYPHIEKIDNSNSIKIKNY